MPTITPFYMQTPSTMSFSPGSWDHRRNQFTAQQHLQLEEQEPYLLAPQDASQQFLQPQHATSDTQHHFNHSLPSYNSPPSHQYGSAPGYQQQHSFQTSSMSSMQDSSLDSVVQNSFTFTPQGYSRASTQAGYQSSFASGSHNPVPSASTNQSGPGFPMQFPYTLQPPARQSEVESQIMTQMNASMAHQSTLPLPKRHRGAEDNEGHPSGSGVVQEQQDSTERPKCTFWLTAQFLC